MGLQIPVGAGSSGMRCVMPSIYKRLGNTIFMGNALWTDGGKCIY